MKRRSFLQFCGLAPIAALNLPEIEKEETVVAISDSSVRGKQFAVVNNIFYRSNDEECTWEVVKS